MPAFQPLHASWRVRASLVWGLPLLVVTVMVAIDPTKRTVVPLYHAASQAWWTGQGLYTGPGGMNYLPQFAILFSPFHALGIPLGDILWRWLSVGFLAVGWWQLAHQLDGPQADRLFCWSSALGIAACLAAVRNGQANGMLAAMMVNAAAFLVQERWWPAAFCLVGGVAIKPLGAVMLLLAPFVYRPVIRPLVITTALFAALPFACAPPAYVLAQFRDVWRDLQACSALAEHRFADINGIFRTLGAEIPRPASLPLRAAAGLVALAAWRRGARLAEPLRGLLLLSLATSYLMLFNPMNEENSYVILAPAVALVAVYLCQVAGEQRVGRLLGGAVLSIGLLPETFRRLDRKFALWWDPLMTIVFISAVLAVVLVRRLPAPDADPSVPLPHPDGRMGA